MSKIVIIIEDSPYGVTVQFDPPIHEIADRLENDKETSSDIYAMMAFKSLKELHEFLSARQNNVTTH